jgi:hypothetical protein
MTYTEASNFTPETIRSPEERIVQLQRVLQGQIASPPQNDPYIRAYASAIDTALQFDGPIRDFIKLTLKTRPQFDGSYLINKIRSALQDHLYFPEKRPGSKDDPPRARILLSTDDERHVLIYPEDYTEPEVWLRAFEAVLDDPDVYGEFLIDVWAHPLTSNISERYKALLMFVAEAHDAGRLDTFDFMDVGPSQHAGANHLMSDIPFEPIVVVTDNGKIDEEEAQRANTHIGTKIRPKKVMGIDVNNPRETRSWTRSCSHYPAELHDTQRVAIYDTLIMSHYDNVLFYRADFATFDQETFKSRMEHLGHGEQSYDIVNFSTVLYQASPEDRTRMIANAKNIAKEFLVVHDFVAVDPNDPNALLFREDWQGDPFPYRTLIMDMRAEKPVWREVYHWRNGRCREMARGMGRAALQQALRAV